MFDISDAYIGTSIFLEKNAGCTERMMGYYPLAFGTVKDRVSFDTKLVRRAAIGS